MPFWHVKCSVSCCFTPWRQENTPQAGSREKSVLGTQLLFVRGCVCTRVCVQKDFRIDSAEMRPSTFLPFPGHVPAPGQVATPFQPAAVNYREEVGGRLGWGSASCSLELSLKSLTPPPASLLFLWAGDFQLDAEWDQMRKGENIEGPAF